MVHSNDIEKQLYQQIAINVVLIIAGKLKLTTPILHALLLRLGPLPKK